MLWLDFETRSRCDLRSRGVYNYAMDASTEVLCMSYAFDDEEVRTWTPDQLFPIKVRGYKGQIRAHNAAFERLVFWYPLQINIPLEQFYCTATQARANCAPGSLEDVGRFSGASMRKDHRGNQLIRALSIPRADGTFNEDPALMAEMIAYCEQDVRAMRAFSKAMRDLSDEELLDYHVNERINDRGVLVDKPLAEAAMRYASAELEDIQRLVTEITKGAITSVRSPRMREWVYDRVGPQAKALMHIEDKAVADTIKKVEKTYAPLVRCDEYSDSDLTVKLVVLEKKRFKVSIDKTVRANLLAMDNPDEVPVDVADVIQCADDLWASSVAKFSRLAELADEEDNRVRGAFVFAGGSATGRASSYGAQVHNFTRKCAKEPEDVRHAMLRGHAVVPQYGKRVTDVLKGMLRPALIPAAGKSFVVADWASIEARVTPWASNSPAGDAKLELFRRNLDVYIANAAVTFHSSYDSILKGYKEGYAPDVDRRQVGKVQELACGFAGGIGAFAAMAKAYNMHFKDHEAQLAVKGWRRANPWAPPYWQGLENAYTTAMRNKNTDIEIGCIVYHYDGLHLWYMLPSGRMLCYPYAKFDEDGISYAKSAWKPAQDAKHWPRARLWKGLACENITQAIANDLLRYALRQLDDVVLHVHDEIVIESDRPEDVASELKRVMTTCPNWAGGLPLAAEVKIMGRYGK
jgi:DNA polymerase